MRRLFSRRRCCLVALGFPHIVFSVKQVGRRAGRFFFGVLGSSRRLFVCPVCLRRGAVLMPSGRVGKHSRERGVRPHSTAAGHVLRSVASRQDAVCVCARARVIPDARAIGETGEQDTSRGCSLLVFAAGHWVEVALGRSVGCASLLCSISCNRRGWRRCHGNQSPRQSTGMVPRRLLHLLWRADESLLLARHPASFVRIRA